MTKYDIGTADATPAEKDLATAIVAELETDLADGLDFGEWCDLQDAGRGSAEGFDDAHAEVAGDGADDGAGDDADDAGGEDEQSLASGPLAAAPSRSPPPTWRDGAQLVLDLPGGDMDLDAARLARTEYERACGPLAETVGWLRYWRHCRGLGLGAETSPFFRENLAQWAQPMGGPSALELAGITPGMSPGLARETVRLTRMEGGYVRRVAPVVFADPSALGLEDMRRLVEPGLRRIPGTWFCPLSGGDAGADAGCRPIPGVVIARLSGIRHRRLRHAAVVEVLLYSEEYPGADLLPVVSGFERWDDAFDEAECDPDVAADVLVVKFAYLIVEHLCMDHAPGPRLGAGVRWDAAGGRLHRLMQEQRDDPALCRALASAKLTAVPNGKPSTRLAAEFAQKRADFGLVCEANRKVDADQLSDNLQQRLATAQVRSRQAVRMWREAAAAEAFLRDNHESGRVGFSWDEDVVSPDGRLLPRRQRLRMEALFADELDGELDGGDPQPRFSFVGSGRSSRLPPDATEADRRALRARNAGRTVHFRWVEVEALSAVAHEPWFVRHFRAGVLLAPGLLDPALRDARRALIVAERLPRLDYHPAGLVGPDGRHEARLFARALNAGVVIVPVASYAHGVALGAGALRTMALTFARVGELLQVTHGQPELWSVEDVEWPGGGKRRRPAWLAFGKGSSRREPFILYEETTLPLLTSLIGLRMLREGRSGRDGVPMSTPCQALARKVGAARYVLAFRGRMLSAGDLNFMHRHLFAGIQRLRNHDVRHAAANRSGQEGATLGEVAFRLRHAGAAQALPARAPAALRVTEMYGRETLKQRAASPVVYADARLQFETLMGGRPEGVRP